MHRRAFNTEIAEQLNSWLDGFKGALNRMTDYNFDFFLYSVLFLYTEDWKYRKEEDARRAQAGEEIRRRRREQQGQQGQEPQELGQGERDALLDQGNGEDWEGGEQGDGDDEEEGGDPVVADQFEGDG